MSSTNINIGFNDGRSSSRVLKPPGGGHSDIFGGQGEEVIRPKQRHQQSSINDCFRMEETVTKTVRTGKTVEQVLEIENAPANAQNGQNGKDQVESKVEHFEHTKVEHTKMEQGKIEQQMHFEDSKFESKTEVNGKVEQGKVEQRKVEQNGRGEENGKNDSSATQRVRVPPGGFSAGFW